MYKQTLGITASLLLSPWSRLLVVKSVMVVIGLGQELENQAGFPWKEEEIQGDEETLP